MYSEVVLGIKSVRTTDGKRPTTSSDANYLTCCCFLQFLMESRTVI